MTSSSIFQQANDRNPGFGCTSLFSRKLCNAAAVLLLLCGTSISFTPVLISDFRGDHKSFDAGYCISVPISRLLQFFSTVGLNFPIGINPNLSTRFLETVNQAEANNPVMMISWSSDQAANLCEL